MNRRLATVLGVLLLAAGCAGAALYGFLRDASSGGISGDGYEPRPYSGAWQEVAPSPLPAGAGYEVLWTGDEVLVLDAGPRDCAFDCDPTRGEGLAAAYDPATNGWRELAELPAAARTWRRTFAIAGDDLFVRVERRQRQDRLFRFDSDVNSWDELDVPGTGSFDPYGTDSHLLAIRHCDCPDPESVALNLATGRWEDLPRDVLSDDDLGPVEVNGSDYGFRVEPTSSVDPGSAPPPVELTAVRHEGDDWVELDTSPVPAAGMNGPVVAGDLIVFAQQPFPIDGPERYTPLANAFDTSSETWIAIDPPPDPMDDGNLVTDGQTVWFGNLILDADERTWHPGQYVPVAAFGARPVWIGDRWFAVGGLTDIGPTRRAYTWVPPR